MTVPGDILIGRYRLVHRIATGGMGSVWEAWDELLQRRVAIKELLTPPGLTKDDAAMARSRVIREARITARLHHPHAVTLYDVVDHGEQPCLILQYVPSRTLSSILAEQGPLQMVFVTRVGAEVASALAAAHQVGVIHRDVKPSNVLITPAGSAVITDFGISHATGDVSITSTGMVSGTPAFLAPEVARGVPSGYPADVFSLGATLYAASEGAPPFGRDQNPMAILHKVASGQIIPPRQSGELTAVLVQMLATDPAARPAMSTVAGLLTDLQNQSSAPEPASASPTMAVPPRTIRAWPADPDQGPGSASPAVGAAVATFRQATSRPATSRSAGSRRRLGAALTAAAVVLLAGLGAYLVISGSRNAQSAAGNDQVSLPASVSKSSRSASAPQSISTNSRLSARATPATPPAPSTSRPPSTSRRPTTSAARPPTSSRPTPTTPSARPATTSTSRAGSAADEPTSTQLAAAITDYYALLPGDTDQAWARLTSNFQTGTAQNRQYYQRFWNSVERVTATDTQGASPDTAEAKVTYFFKDGRTAVELTVYSLVRQGGILMIDSSTVLSSTAQ